MIAATPLMLVLSASPAAPGERRLIAPEYGRPLGACRYGIEDCHPLHHRAWVAKHLEGKAQ